MYLCFYHGSDADGWLSGAIVYNVLSKLGVKDNDIKMVPINYSDISSFNDVYGDLCTEASRIYMVDFALNNPWSLMHDFINKFHEKLTWFDHHSAVYKHYIQCKLPKFEGGCGEESYPAACELVWRYFNSKHNAATLFSVTSIPFAVQLISYWDTGLYYMNDLCRPFHWGLQSIKFHNNPRDEVYLKLLHDDKIIIQKLIDRGETIMDFQDMNRVKIVPARVFKSRFIVGSREYSAVCCNYGKGGYQFKGLDDNADLRVVFERVSAGWKVHIYPRYGDETIHCEEIASYFGGGGHGHAIGSFEVSSIDELRKIIPEV